jgi:hypothetical protein
MRLNNKNNTNQNVVVEGFEMINLKRLFRSTNHEASRYVVSQISYYLLTLRPKSLPMHHILEHSQFITISY